jgi:hypothetical protein
VKKLFALLAVFSLAAIGCDDKSKSTGKPTNATQGGTYMKTDTREHDVTNKVTNTVVQNTVDVTRVHTAATTVTVNKTPDKGPGPSVPPAGGDKDKKPGDK